MGEIVKVFRSTKFGLQDVYKMRIIEDMSWYYHSRDPRCKVPFGAVRTGETVKLRLDGDAGRAPQLLLDMPGWQYSVPMDWDGSCYRASFVAPAYPCRMGYGFRLDDGRFFGAQSGEAGFSDTPQLFGLTVYDGAFQTPEWFRRAVCYQIFPDRFYCADRARFLKAAADYRVTGRPIFVHETWDEKPYDQPHGGAKDYAPDDYFGGDLAGIREKLPYLASLGVTCLYLNPIFEAHSNHRYNTADYRNVDPLLGTNEDFEALAKRAKEYGIRIILDGVFSHTGDDSIYFDRYHRYDTHGACESKESPYYSWYRFYDWPTRYECWWNFETLPNVEETEPHYTEFIQGEDGVLELWLRRGASGWRLDVADELPDSFIRGVRSTIKRHDPDAVLIGEVWDNCATKFGPEGRRGYVNGDELDAAMNYPFRDPTVEFLNRRIDAYAYADALNTLIEDYPRPFLDACLNLLGSHDTERIKTALCGIPDARTLSKAQQRAYRPDEPTLQRAKARVLAATALQMTLPGVPCIFAGDEVGVTGMCDPLNRVTFPWGGGDGEQRERIKALIALRKDSKAIQTGAVRIAAVGRDTVCVIRDCADELLILLVNAGDAPFRASVYPALFREGPDANRPLSLAGVYRDTNGNAVTARDTLCCTVPPVSAVILRKA